MEIIVIRIEYKLFLLFRRTWKNQLSISFLPSQDRFSTHFYICQHQLPSFTIRFRSRGIKENQSPRICPKQPSIIQTAYRTTITYRKIIIESILPISNRHHSDIISGPSIPDTIIYHTAYMSIGQSVLQSVYSFQLILLPSINTDNDIQISCINLIIVIYINSSYSRLFQSIFFLNISFYSNLYSIRFKSFQTSIRPNPHIAFFILCYCKYILYFFRQFNALAFVSFKFNLHQPIWSAYPQTIPWVQAKTINNSLYPLTFIILQMKGLHLIC